MSPRFDSPPPETGNTTSSPRNAISQPRFRFAKSAAEVAEVRVKNRRRAYLDRNPGYFESSEHEFADPLLYDSLIRRFQQPEEMKDVAQKQGFARVLEGSLVRGEERLSKMAAEDSKAEASLSNLDRLSVSGNSASQDNTATGTRSSRPVLFGDMPEPEPKPRPALFGAMLDSEPNPKSKASGLFGELSDPEPAPKASTSRSRASGRNQGSFNKDEIYSQQSQGTTPTPTPLEADILGAPPVTTKEAGLEMWETFLRERFIRGGDEEFEYAVIDEDDEYDVIERRDQEEAWYDEEEPEWASDDGGDSHDGDGQDVRMKVERVLEGETGVQDY